MNHSHVLAYGTHHGKIVLFMFADNYQNSRFFRMIGHYYCEWLPQQLHEQFILNLIQNL
jgi:hypothetical protein